MQLKCLSKTPVYDFMNYFKNKKITQAIELSIPMFTVVPILFIFYNCFLNM